MLETRYTNREGMRGMIESIGKAFYFGVVFAIVVFGMVLSGGAGLILAIKVLELIFY